MRSSIANNAAANTIQSPPSNIRVARRLATEQNGYISDDDDDGVGKKDQDTLDESTKLSFSMNFKFEDDDDKNGENNSEFGDIENGIDIEMKLSQRMRQEIKAMTRVATNKGKKNGLRKTTLEHDTLSNKVSKTLSRSVGKKSNSLRQGQKVKRKNRRNSNISKPKGGKRRPTKSPNVARRKTKLRGQITSPDTSPVRRGGGMSMTL